MNTIKRSDGVASRGRQVMAPAATAHNAQASHVTACVDNDKKNKKVSTMKKQQQQQQLIVAESIPATSSAATPINYSQQTQETPQTAPSTNRLVFGLNPRTNKSSHHEYARQRLGLAKQQEQPRQQQQNLLDTVVQTNQPVKVVLSKGASGEQTSVFAGSTSNQKTSSTTIRASKYGNFYKPQDLTGNNQQKIVDNRGARVLSEEQQQQQQQQLLVEDKMMMQRNNKSSSSSSSSTAASEGSMQEGDARQQLQRTRDLLKTTPHKTTQADNARIRSKSPLGGAGRRKSLDEMDAGRENEQHQQQQRQQETTTNNTPPSCAPLKAARTHFNILPPPQMSIATTGTGSVVNYAKSRIYDRPVKQILNNPPPSTLLFDDYLGGPVPRSIVCGKKPPKQVNVKRAREKWEGGEPFAKCKSRQRLAAQANKKLFPGTWSMTSVVATQQLHLQQALAQSSASVRSNIHQTDPSVKMLTRGAVLERMQQYERALTSSQSSGTVAGSSSTLSSLSSSSSSSACSSTSDYLGVVDDDDQVELTIASNDNVQRVVDGTNTSKRAQYKYRVSSLQQQQQQQLQLQSSTPQCAASVKSSPTSTATTLATQSNAPPQLQQQRRLSLRRRSSLLGRRDSTGGATTHLLIPKFYQPNGRPNTYEIEMQKRNICACFDKLPDRSAQLLDGPQARKHFHQIALACNFSEYFKVPLAKYVQHKLTTCPHLLNGSATDNGTHLRRLRKTSTVSLLEMNGGGGGVHQASQISSTKSLLTKSASVDSSAINDIQAKDTNSVNKSTNGFSNNKPPLNKEKQANHLQQQQSVISHVTCDQFLACWRHLVNETSADQAARFMHLLTFGTRTYLVADDFVPLVQSIIDDHPGLKFLRAAPDFHMRYIQTVIARIYFNINKSWTNKLSLQELRKSNLLAVLQVLSQEEDINQITDYFSYEHFYVIYCKFWNLDQDHDLFISKEDLARHNEAAISSRIIERIFAGVVSKQITKTGKMSYTDFVWFLIAEEDKKHPRSIEYWFRLMDLDGDGYISMYEMEYFYYEQMKRLELMHIEALPFTDSACQILDLVNPKEGNKISLADLKRTKMATIFFDTFINLEKYLEHESREFVSTRDTVQDGVVVSDWDRFASEEYESLVTEESSV